MKKLALLTSVALLAGCSLIPDYQRPATDMPDAFLRQENAEVTNPQAISIDWWKNFNSAELNDYMDKALAQNNDIRAAIARIAQARANVKIAQSKLWPQVGASSSAGRNYVSGGSSSSATSFTTGTSVGGSVGSTSNRSSYVAGLDVSYEVDLLGGNHAAIAAAKADEKASIYEAEAVKLTTMSDVARNYFNVINLRERVGLAQNNLKTSQELLRIVNARFEAGASSALEVAQQKTSLSNTEASLTALQQQEAAAEDALSVLVGTSVQNVKLAKTDLNDVVVPTIAPVQPSELLERRPDIRSAEASLIAANANIGVARAQYFPAINLSAGVELATAALSDSARTLTNFSAGLTGPIFSGGAIEGGVELTEARKEELVQNYLKSVLVSLQEVEDALSEVKSSDARNASLKEGVTQAQKAYDLSTELYKSGATDFQTLLTSESALIQTQDVYAQTRLENLSAAIDLYKALGGGWNDGVVQNPKAISISKDGDTTVTESKTTAVSTAPATPLAPPPATTISQ